MKFKYKKMIIAITMCTMCIGMVTISLITPDSSSGKKSAEYETTEENKLAQLNDESNLINEAGVEEKAGELEISDKEELDKLIETYLNCRLTGDEEKLAKIVTDINKIDMEELQKLRMLISEYKNVECYTVETDTKGSYIVYVYYEILFSGARTTAPGLDRVYVVTDSDGTFKLDFGTVPEEVKKIIEKSEESEEVRKMIKTVNTKLEEAISKDEKLRSIYANLNGGSDEVDTKTKKEDQQSENTDTEKPEATKDNATASEQPEETDEPFEDTEAVRE